MAAALPVSRQVVPISMFGHGSRFNASFPRSTSCSAVGIALQLRTSLQRPHEVAHNSALSANVSALACLETQSGSDRSSPGFFGHRVIQVCGKTIFIAFRRVRIRIVHAAQLSKAKGPQAGTHERVFDGTESSQCASATSLYNNSLIGSLQLRSGLARRDSGPHILDIPAEVELAIRTEEDDVDALARDGTDGSVCSCTIDVRTDLDHTVSSAFWIRQSGLQARLEASAASP